MPTITVDDTVWLELARMARQVRREPEALAADALREYIQRLDDEELLARSAHEAAASSFDIEDTESLVRARRARKRGTH